MHDDITEGDRYAIITTDDTMNNIIMKNPVSGVIQLAKMLKTTTPENIAIGRPIYQIKALLDC